MPNKHNLTCLILVGAAWLGNGLYAVGAPDGLLKFWSPALVAGAMLWFLFMHGKRAEGRACVFLFVVTIFLIGWIFETISILTGFPFGHYHYTEIMGPFLGHVPVSVMPAYCVMGYISWATARVVLLRVDDASDRVTKFAVPIVAALLMVLWDVSMDPLRATIEGRWVWRDGGPHFGIPLLNFAGWFLVTYLMFQLYALLKPARRNPPPAEISGTGFWMSAPLMYLAFPVEYLLNPLTNTGAAESVLVNGILVPVKTIQSDIATLTALTMVPVAMLAVARLMHRRRSRHGQANGPSTVRQVATRRYRRPFSK